MPCPTDSDPQAWHRYFAIECNNRAWDLTAKQRSPAESEEMLHAAHAAAWHWAACGTELNRMRATMLLAEVHALLGFADSAVQFAKPMRDYFVAAGADTPDWELALAHTIYAHAVYVAGDYDAHRGAYADAQTAFDAIADPDDREIVQATFDLVPSP